MQKIFFTLLALIVLVDDSIGQEVLRPMLYNPQLVHHFPPPSHSASRSQVLVQFDTLLIESDTLVLPFIDEFSTNTLKPIDYLSKYITGSITNAYGLCVDSFKTKVVSQRFMINPSWDYTFNVALQRVDSTPKSPIVIKNFTSSAGDCFSQAPVLWTLYPEYYRYIFDSTTGNIKSKTLVKGNGYLDTTILYTPTLITSKMPAFCKWVDNFAYHNYTYPYLPPTLGVATLDGLNEHGRPYNNSSPFNQGLADKLTSKPIDMSGLTDADSVYFSFYYEPRGYGDYPNTNDSLVLEFLNGYTSQWDRVWRRAGFASKPVLPDTFNQVILRVPGTVVPTRSYFYKGFQFRFVNYATLAGNNDHWHIDYVRLNKGRSVTDTAINDIAFQYPFPNILKNYEEMPAEQFTGRADVVDTLRLNIANDNQPQANNNPPATQYGIVANSLYPTSASMFTTNSTFNAGPNNVVLLYPNTGYNIPAPSGDSIVLNSTAYLNVANVLYANDTISRNQVMTHTLAYDDGSAELTYGLDYTGLKKFAYEFNLHQPDTLVGFQVMFGNIDVDVHDLVFTYNLWDSLKLNDVFFKDSAIYTSSNQKPTYLDTVNGFATYRIAPKAVPTKFYLGWAQTDVRNLQVGFDANSNKGKSHMYYYSSGTWKKSNLRDQGSPMIRLLLGKSYQYGTAIAAGSIEPIKIYPNPTTGMIHLSLPASDNDYEAEVTNLLGQVVKHELIDQQTIDVSVLNSGIYLLKVTNLHTGVAYQNKITKE